MQSFRYTCIFIFVLFLLNSCGEEDSVGHDERLAKAECLIESRPDSAAAIIDSIDLSRLKSHDRIRAMYLNGKARLAMNNHSAAASSLLRAEKLAKAEGEDSLLALSCRAMMDLYKSIDDINEQAAYAVKACEVYARHNDYDNMHETLSEFTSIFDNIPYNHTDEIKHYAKILSHNDTTTVGYFDGEPVSRGSNLYCFLQDIGKLEYWSFRFVDGLKGFSPGRFIELVKSGGNWREVLLNDSTYVTAPHANLVAVTLRGQGYEKEAGEFLDCYRNNYREKITEYTTDPKTGRAAWHVTKRVLDLDNKALIAELQKDVKAAVTQFHYEEEVMQEHTIRFQRIIIVIITALTLTIAIAVVLYVRLMASRRRRREEAGMQAASELRTALRNLEEQHLETLTHLCNTYYENYNAASVTSRVARDTLKAIRGIADREDFFPRLEKHLDNRNDGLMSQLRTEIPTLRENDMRLYLCNALGLSIPAICLLLGEKRDVIYTRRLRLRAKIQESDAIHKERLLEYLR